MGVRVSFVEPEGCLVVADRGIERAYAATVTAVTGGWLAAAIASGPAAKPLPAIAGIATVLLGIPWWFHRRRRAKARVEKTISAWPEVAENAGLPGSEILSVVVDAWGWTARVLLRKGITPGQVISKIPALESGLRLRPGSMRVSADDKRADRFIMRVIENDPHAEPAPWPGRWTTSVTKPMELGLSENGREARVLLVRRNVLIGGIMGSGKSGILNVIIANLAGCRDVMLWGIDMKGGMELQPWAACFDRLAFTPEQAIELFRDAVTELDERAARMAAEGKRVWEPTPDDPALRGGQRVAVYGASGAVGTSAVQLARHFGADVTGVCTGANLELVRSLGAATVIDYTANDLTQNQQPYDVIFDAVGKRKSAAALRQVSGALAPGGICISVDDGTPKLLARDLTRPC